MYGLCIGLWVRGVWGNNVQYSMEGKPFSEGRALLEE